MANSRPFMDFLRQQRNGVTHDELSDALQNLVAAVAEEGKGGALTFTITVKPAESGDGAMLVTDDIKVRPPKRSKSASIFFVSPENNLVREDPRQTTLALREIGAGAEPREIGTATASVAATLA